MCKFKQCVVGLLVLWSLLMATSAWSQNACVDALPGSNNCDVSVLSDDFLSPASLAEWQILDVATPAQSLIDNEQLRLTVPQGFWYMNNSAPLFYKELAGDFMITTHVSAVSNSDANAAPNQRHNSAGLMVRAPQSGDGNQNYVMVDIGRQWDANGSLTRNTQSSFTDYQFQAGDISAQLRICRIGNQYRVLRRASANESWQELNRYQRDDMPNRVQVGLVINAWQSPSDMLALFEHATFATPASPQACSDQVADPTPATLAALAISDEFDVADTLSQWLRLHEVEQTPALYHQLGIATGQLTIVPQVGGWYMNTDATLLYKNITGNFVISSYVSATGRMNTEQAPNSDYNSMGVMARDPTGSINPENWLMMVTGRQGGWLGTLAENTQNDYTISVSQSGSLQGELRLCRINNRFYLWRRLQGDTNWVESAVYDRADMPATLQVGLMAHAWSGPEDLRANFDYARFAVPQSASECTLPITPVETPVTPLSDEFNGTIDLLSDNTSAWSLLGGSTQHRMDNADIGISRNGHLLIRPQVFAQNAWFGDSYGPLIYKNISGNFAVTTRVRVNSRFDQNSAPNVGFNAGGFVIRDAARTHQGDENWMMYNVGAQLGPNWNFAREVKKTVNSESNLFLTPQGSMEEQLLVCRIDDDFYFYFWDEVAQAWQVERMYNQYDLHGQNTTTFNNRDTVVPEIGALPAAGEAIDLHFHHPAMPDTVQVGVMAHAWSDSDTEAAFDFVRFSAEPPQSIAQCTAAFSGQ